jgi:hypothetical protein
MTQAVLRKSSICTGGLCCSDCDRHVHLNQWLRSGSVSICRMRILQQGVARLGAAFIAQPESGQVNPVVG